MKHVKLFQELALRLTPETPLTSVMLDEIARLREELADAQVDAKRYRFLRQPNIGIWNVSQWASEPACFVRLDWNELDAAIDEAIRKEKIE